MRILSSAQTELSSRDWDDFVRNSPAGHLLQSWSWGELKAHFGWRPLRIAVAEESSIAAAAQVLFRPLPMPGLTTAYIPKGPVVDSSLLDAPATVALMQTVNESCRQHRAAFLKLEPDWPEGSSLPAWLEAQGFSPSGQTVQPRRTVIVDLTAGEEHILAQMKPKTRYNIRLAQRKGVTVQPGTAEHLPLFHRLLQITGRRAGFGIHTLAYYAEAWRLFADRGDAALFLANYANTTLAAIMVFVWDKRAYYMYGASSDEERQRMPTYLLQWEAMRWAKARGCETYDLWGIPDVDEDDVGPDVAAAEETGILSSGLGGLYRFKRGFGGAEIRYVGAYDRIYNRPLYRLLTTAWNWRNR